MQLSLNHRSDKLGMRSGRSFARSGSRISSLSSYQPLVHPYSQLLAALAFKWSQLSDSVFLDRVNSGKIPLFYGLVKHSSRTPPNSSCTPNLLAILLAIGRC